MPQHVFKNYQEFFSLTRPLSDNQRDILLKSLTSAERRRLLRAYKSEGWNNLLVRNKINNILDQIKEEFGEDLVLLRIQVLSGKVRKVRKAFWNYVNDVLAEYSVSDKAYVLDGISYKEYQKDWVILVPSKRRDNGKKEDSNG